MLLHSLENAIGFYDICIGSDVVVSCAYLSILAEKVVALYVKNLR